MSTPRSASISSSTERCVAARASTTTDTPRVVDLVEQHSVGELGVVEADADVGGVGDVLRRLGDADADGGHRLCAERQSGVEHEHGDRRDHRGAPSARRTQRDDPALAVDQVLRLRELLDVVGGIGDEQEARGVDERVALRARTGDLAEDLVQLVLVARVAVDPGAGHHLRVVLAVPGDRLEGDHRQPDRERLHAGEAACVLDQGVGRGHERRHLVGPPDHGAEAPHLELGPEVVVAPAHGDGVELAASADGLDGGDDVAHAPRAGDDEHGAVVGREAEVAAHGLAVVARLPEAVADQRPAGPGVLAAARGRRRRPRSRSPPGGGRCPRCTHKEWTAKSVR